MDLFARPAHYRNSDKPACLLNPRNLQQTVRAEAALENPSPEGREIP
jgi:hypothetical protein